MALLVHDWPASANAWSGKTEQGPDGRLIFQVWDSSTRCADLECILFTRACVDCHAMIGLSTGKDLLRFQVPGRMGYSTS
eukprot:scaffold143139_cov19-Tisochrysis_lutea.AAC.1